MPDSARDMPDGTKVVDLRTGQLWEKVDEDRWERRGWVRSGWIDGMISDGIMEVLDA